MSSRTHSSGIRRLVTAITLAAGALAAVPTRPLAADGVARTARPTPVTCTGAIQHPLSVRIETLDPVLRGATVRLRLTTTALRGLGRGTARLSSSGGAAVVGASRVALRAVPAGGQAAADFAVVVPPQGERFLLQFRVQAEGSSRGATYNLLPDGPSEHPRDAATAKGDKVSEVTARRIDR